MSLPAKGNICKHANNHEFVIDTWLDSHALMLIHILMPNVSRMRTSFNRCRGASMSLRARHDLYGHTNKHDFMIDARLDNQASKFKHVTYVQLDRHANKHSEVPCSKAQLVLVQK